MCIYIKIYPSEWTESTGLFVSLPSDHCHDAWIHIYIYIYMHMYIYNTYIYVHIWRAAYVLIMGCCSWSCIAPPPLPRGQISPLEWESFVFNQKNIKTRRLYIFWHKSSWFWRVAAKFTLSVLSALFVCQIVGDGVSKIHRALQLECAVQFQFQFDVNNNQSNTKRIE